MRNGSKLSCVITPLKLVGCPQTYWRVHSWGQLAEVVGSTLPETLTYTTTMPPNKPATQGFLIHLREISGQMIPETRDSPPNLYAVCGNHLARSFALHRLLCSPVIKVVRPLSLEGFPVFISVVQTSNLFVVTHHRKFRKSNIYQRP